MSFDQRSLCALLLLVLCSSLVSISDASVETGVSCPFNANNTEYFPEYATQQTLTVCSQFSPSACCNPIYDALISGSKDYVGKTFKRYLKPSSQCKQAIKGAQCLLCSPAQSTFFSLHSYGNSIKLCESFCNSLYENCKDSKLVGKKDRTVAQEFDDSSHPGDDFCYAVFHPQWNIDVSSTNCEINRPCTEDDYVGAYTPCHNGVRSAVFYLKENVKCTGGVPLPQTKTDLPCEISCGPGEALLIGDTECTPCAPGSYSIGGGDTYEDWDSKPRDFITFCTQYDEKLKEITLVEGCGWQWNGTITASGYHWNDLNLNVTLEVGAAFIRSGATATFEAKVSASPGHNKLFFLLGEQEIWRTSRTAGYEIFQFDIPQGHHVLKWIYSKDGSGSMGEDQASIRWIQLSGTKLADDSCTLCEPGTYQSSPKSSLCPSCSSGTYSANYGATECDFCPGNTDSWSGATECFDKPACTPSDLITFYGECGSSGKRSFNHAFAAPVVCDNSTVSLPTQEFVDCAACPEGYHRDGSTCAACSIGTFWDGTACVDCPAGSAAPAYKIYESFDSGWKNIFGTSCSGIDCATSGWQLNGTSISSGNRQGPNVISDVWIDNPVKLTAGDKITADLTLYCTSERSGNIQIYPCEFTFFVIEYASLAPLVYEISNTSRRAVTQLSYEWNATVDGEYRLLLSFRKSSAVTGRNDDKAVLNRLAIQTDEGSAATCELCPAGTSTNGKSKQTRCSECPAGHYSNPGSAVCLPCEENTFSATSNSPSCKPCGFGTSSNADKTGCIDHCYVAFDDVEYDLSKLKRDEMYGPIYDKNHERYFIDVCKIPETTYSCVDGQGNPVHAYVCQITNNINPVGLNLGTFVSYSQNERGDIRSGLTVNYTGGSGGCKGQYRSTTIHFTCDPEAGVGTPEPFEPVENPLCHYSFLWPSTYACPLCTARDYTYDQSDCVGGQATQVFRWLYPKRCHDGVSLPDPIITSCSTELAVCGEGYYWDNVESKCTICPAGYYCEDGGILYDDWTNIPAGFNITGHWDTASSYLFSQGGTLSRTVNFQRPGTVTTVYNAYLSDAKLSLTVDNNENILPVGSTDFETKTYSVPVSLGTHQLTWTLTPGTSRLDYGYGLFIHNITMRGLFTSLTKPVPCPAGTSSEEGQTSCTPCPANYTSVSTGPCTVCDVNFYSRPGDSQCNPIPTCAESDWQALWTDCSKGTKQTVYVKINMCRSDPPGVSKYNSTFAKTNCGNCPPGYLRKDENGNTTDDCRPCPNGFYVSAGKCVAVPKGYVAPLERGLWQNQSSISLPDGFSTGCAGLSCVSNGWRIRDTSIESGSQESGFADSWLKYDVTLVSDGSITFQYSTGNDGDHSGLQFYIDQVLQDSVIFANSGARSSGTIPLKKGKHQLLWNYHHQSEKSAQAMASLMNIRVRGDSRGGASTIEQCKKGSYADKQLQCVPCPPGSYSDGDGKTSCSLCSKGTFSDEAGASQCKKCPKGTYSDSNGATFCSSSCTFNNGGRTYDLAPLNQVQTVLASGHFLIMRLCDRLPKNLSEPAGEKTDSFITDLQSQQSLGKYLTQSDAPSGANLQLTFAGASTSDCPEYTTDITFYCEMPNDTNTVAYGVQSGPVLTRTSKCNSKFAWKSFYACPLCRNYEVYDDYTQQTTECEKNSQNVSYIRTTACFGPAIVGFHTEPCSNKVAFPMYVLISLAVVFIALAIIAIVFYINYRSLNSRYSLLVEEKNKNLEMNEIASNSSNQSAEENTA